MPKIEELYACVVDDTGPDDEGIVTAKIDELLFPLMGADLARVKTLKPIALKLSKAMGKPIKLLRFTNRIEVEVIDGTG